MTTEPTTPTPTPAPHKATPEQWEKMRQRALFNAESLFNYDDSVTCELADRLAAAEQLIQAQRASLLELTNAVCDGNIYHDKRIAALEQLIQGHASILASTQGRLAELSQLAQQPAPSVSQLSEPPELSDEEVERLYFGPGVYEKPRDMVRRIHRTVWDAAMAAVAAQQQHQATDHIVYANKMVEPPTLYTLDQAEEIEEIMTKAARTAEQTCSAAEMVEPAPSLTTELAPAQQPKPAADPKAEATEAACEAYAFRMIDSDHEDHRGALAAFLEVVTDEVVPDEGRRYPIHLSSASWMRWDERKRARAKLLAIAAELRGQGASTNNTEAQA